MANWTEADLRNREARFRHYPAKPGEIDKTYDRMLAEDQKAKAKRQPRVGYRSKVEERYAAQLELMRTRQLIQSWAYEAVTLVLAPGVRYVPDFMVVVNGEVQFNELKGRKGDGFWSLPVSKVKVRLAAKLFPWWKFRIVWPAERTGEWETVEVGE